MIVIAAGLRLRPAMGRNRGAAEIAKEHGDLLNV
jgi:hypothetical protein